MAKNTQIKAKTTELLEAYEYKQEADRVLLPRANSPVAITFDENSTEEEIRNFILG